MTIEKCINEFDVDDVIFEEGSTGRELFVVLDGGRHRQGRWWAQDGIVSPGRASSSAMAVIDGRALGYRLRAGHG